MEKKYLFFDIDGTLTDRSTGEIVPSAREALTRLEENGHFGCDRNWTRSLQSKKIHRCQWI